MPKVTATKNDALCIEVRNLVRTVAREKGNKVYKVYTDKRTSEHRSNIAGRQCKMHVNNTKCIHALLAVLKSFDCTAVVRTVAYNRSIYIKILRNS